MKEIAEAASTLSVRKRASSYLAALRKQKARTSLQLT